MIRLLRILSNILALASLLFCIAASVKWIQGSITSPIPYEDIPRGGYRLISRGGQLALVHHSANVAPSWAWVMTTAYVTTDGKEPVVLVKALIGDPAGPWDIPKRITGELWSRPYVWAHIARGIHWDNAGGFGGSILQLPLPRNSPQSPGAWTYTQSVPVLWSVTVPYWALRTLFAVLPCRWFIRRRRNARRRFKSCCQICGYDLRASPNRCPECGTGR